MISEQSHDQWTQHNQDMPDYIKSHYAQDKKYFFRRQKALMKMQDVLSDFSRGIYALEREVWK